MRSGIGVQKLGMNASMFQLICEIGKTAPFNDQNKQHMIEILVWKKRRYETWGWSQFRGSVIISPSFPETPWQGRFRWREWYNSLLAYLVGLNLLIAPPFHSYTSFIVTTSNFHHVHTFFFGFQRHWRHETGRNRDVRAPIHLLSLLYLHNSFHPLFFISLFPQIFFIWFPSLSQEGKLWNNERNWGMKIIWLGYT